MKHKDALGKGIEELMLENFISDDNTEVIIELDLSCLIANPDQPRKDFDKSKLNDLAQSIKENGVIQPIIVKEVVDGYKIVAGERRYRASKLAGRTTIPAIIRPYKEEMVAEVALLENLQRENLNVIEEAVAYNYLIKRFNITQEELSKRVGKSRSHITNILGLLHLPKQIQGMISNKQITMGHARALSKLNNEERIIKLAHKIVNNGLSVREIEKLAQQEEKKNKIKINHEKNIKK